MKKLMFIVFLVFATIIPGLAEDTENPQLRDELLHMEMGDQEIRERLKPLFINPDVRDATWEPLIKQMVQIDGDNIRRLEEMIKEHGWPGILLVGEQASHAAWLILQHADTERQKRYLPVLKLAVSKGDAYASDLAMMEDRILTNEGKKQLYGTQIVSGDDGNPKLYPIEDPANLDVRRKAVGLSPIDEYLKLAESELGMPVDRSPLLE